MNKRIIIVLILISFVVIGLIIYLMFFYTIGLTLLSDEETISDYCSSWKTYAVVSNSGNCYLNGEASYNEPYGVNNIRKYHSATPQHYVCIYEKGDAKHINLSFSGGIIVTDKNELYAFVNQNSELKVPSLVGQNCVDACVCRNNRLFLLKENGDFGYINLDDRNSFHLVKSSIIKIQLISRLGYETLFVLSNDHHMFAIDSNSLSETLLSNWDNTLDFDISAPYEESCVIGRITDEGDCFVNIGALDLNAEKIQETKGTKVGEGMITVAAYGKGIAMQNRDGDVFLYGDDLNSETYQKQFNGEMHFQNVQVVYGGDLDLTVLYKNGTFEQYGRLPNGVYQEIIHHS